MDSLDTFAKLQGRPKIPKGRPRFAVECRSPRSCLMELYLSNNVIEAWGWDGLGPYVSETGLIAGAC